MGRRGDGGGVGEIFLLSYGLRFLCRAGVCGLGEKSLIVFFSFGPDGRLIDTCMWWLGVLAEKIEMGL